MLSGVRTRPTAVDLDATRGLRKEKKSSTKRARPTAVDLDVNRELRERRAIRSGLLRDAAD